LLMINKATGEGTEIGPIGFDAAYSQGMDFDEESGTLYLAAYNGTTFRAELRMANTTTGNTALIGSLGVPGETQMTTMAVATGGESVTPWASAVPNSGIVAPNRSMTFDLIFDASSLSQIGQYRAQLRFDGTFNNQIQPLDVVMDLIPDDDNDGVDNNTECAVSDDCDGNRDGIPDNQQLNVASLPNPNGDYVTLVVPDAFAFETVRASAEPPLNAPTNLTFPQGFYDFAISGLAPGEAISMQLIMHGGEMPNRYYNYGPEPDQYTDHWYEFNYNGLTGAETMTKAGQPITLHLKDDERGDHDLTPNGTIVHRGGPVKIVDTSIYIPILLRGTEGN